MYEKKTISNFLEKVYLNGIIENIRLESDNGNLQTIFRNSEGNFRGEVILSDIQLPNGLIGVYYPKKLLNFLAILDDSILVEYNGVNTDDSVVSIELSDDKGKKAIYAATALSLIDYDGKKAVVKNYDVSLDLTPSIIQDILKCFNAMSTAIDAQTITFLNKNDKLYAVFGYSSSTSNTDQIEFELDANVDDYDDIISFPALYLKEALTINSREFTEATLEISIKGILRLSFKENNITSEYWLRKNND